MSEQKNFRIGAAQEEEMGIELNDSPQPTPSYQREISGQQLESYIDDIADTVRVGLDQSISILTPWFFNNMPKIYYQTTPRQEKVRHLSAIITGHVFETKQTVELWDRDKSKVTYIGPGGDRKILSDMALRISNNNLKMGAVYFSRDNLLFLSTFFCTDYKTLDLDNVRIVEKVTAARELMHQEYPENKNEIESYVKHLDNDFVMYATAARLSITFRMVKYMLSHQGAHTFIDTFENSPNARLTLGLKNVNPAQMMEPILSLIHRYDFTVGRAFVARFDEGFDESITVMHFIMSHGSGDKITPKFVPMIRLNKALRTMGWVDYDDFSVFSEKPYDFSVNATNLIRSFATYAHLFLSKRNPYAYNLYKIRNTFAQNYELLDMLVKYFRAKFDPSLPPGEWERNSDESISEIKKGIDNLFEDIDRHIFKKCLKFIKHCIKTNYFLPTKTGLAFRLDPEILDSKHYPDKPFGIFFILGKDFRFFHVRWRDVARGGMRVVMPRSAADYDMALAGLFDEVYGLSHAQQLKNKDIPEGGSKAVLVLKPGGHRDQAVKGSVNALLDLLVEQDESQEDTEKLITYYNKTEIIYLGPDENITNDLINWIPAQARRRGYKYAPAFMSSKPGEGINHKEYGVTSEGVNVYVHNTLQFLGINPKTDKFKVKMTGGPDGDVAGNELLILYREYNENALVVSISDGFGAAYDPQGLDWKELLRLVKESKPIIEFDRKKLSKSKEAFLIAADSNENIKTRNEIYRRVYADIFIPAGGRPYSVNDKNWAEFFDADGKPTVRAIVEGANIFFTEGARERLQNRGVFIIKDSSANKTGVICSSFEIIASLVISAQEFLDIKEDYVKQVIEILRNKADAEAKLLFRVYAEEDGTKSLVDLSLQISKEINRITDVLLENLSINMAEVLQDPLYQAVVIDHCPPVLVEKYRERILSSLPEAHQIAIIASSIASYVVYNEGLTWLKSIPRQHWFEALKIYIEKDRLTHQLLQDVEKSNLKDREQVEAILSMSAARNLTVMELQSRAILK